MSNEQVITRTEEYLADFSNSYLLNGLKLEKRFDKCILLKGGYVKKYRKIKTLFFYSFLKTY